MFNGWGMMREAKRMWTFWDFMLLALCVFPLLPLFDHLGKGASGPPAAFSAAIIFVTVKWRWDLSDKLWFRLMVLMIVAAHIPLIFFIPWSTRRIPGLVTGPVWMVDALCILALINWAEKLFDREAKSPSGR
jgi:hypothetical protein